MFLGIEIGGTKLQLGVGSGKGGPLVAMRRLDVDPSRGADGIRRQIRDVAGPLVDEHRVAAVGIGFGGPVDRAAGRTIHSFQVDGWDDFPLADWCRRALGLPTVLGNDSDLAGLGEARFGAGQGARIVFYSNVGSGIGGSLVIDGELYGGSRGVASEIGHLRPGPEAASADQTVESVASGWGMAAVAKAKLLKSPEQPGAADLLARSEGRIDRLTAVVLAEAYAAGNPLAADVFLSGIRTYGWALAEVITLLAPHVVVIGGGVPQIGEALYLKPLRREIERYVFPPLQNQAEIVAAALGEEVVVHGALALAAAAHSPAGSRSSTGI